MPPFAMSLTFPFTQTFYLSISLSVGPQYLSVLSFCAYTAYNLVHKMSSYSLIDFIESFQAPLTPDVKNLLIFCIDRGR